MTIDYYLLLLQSKWGCASVTHIKTTNMNKTFIGYIVTISEKVSEALPTETSVLRYCQRHYHQSYRHGLLSSDIKVTAIADNGTAYRLQVFENGNTWSLEEIWKEVSNG